MLRKIFCHLFVLNILSAIAAPVCAGSITVFGPKDLIISKWHVHLSHHTFDVDNPGDGVIIITKNTPEKNIQGGFLFFNGRLISIMNFLKGNDTVFEKDVALQSINHFTLFLGGTTDASIAIEVRKIGLVTLPEVVFSVNPQYITYGESSTLTWTTTNADSISIDQGIGGVGVSGSITVSPTETTTYTITATGLGGTATASVTVAVTYPPPTVNISADPGTIMAGEPSTLTWSSTNADTCVIEPGIGSVDPNGSISVSPTETTTYTITATGLGGTATASVAVTVTYPPPTVSINADPGTIMVGESSTLTWSSTNADTCVIEPVIGTVDLNGSISVSPTETTTYTITVTGLGGTTGAQVLVTLEAAIEPQPEGSFGEQYQDLVPLDVTIESYDPKRFSVITGLVQDTANLPIADVSVTILDHPEYGTATTDTDGRFSIPVEGGGTITVVYQKEGLITAHRKVYVPWNDIAITETIVMIVEDPTSTTLTFDGYPDTVVTHQSTEVTDEFGSRSCTTVFTGDNHAYEVDAQGNVIQELTTITTRATEYTTPESMPAILPPNSAYTYCVELGVDGAQRVRFDKPVITWVDNFLGFDVGEIVPVGYYDRDKGVWVPSDNGVVVKLLDTDTDGIVDALDANGDDLPDDLNDNGSFSDEVTGLNDAQKYPPGSNFWRVAVTHFTPWDCNWPYGPPTDATSPNTEVPSDTDQQYTEGRGCPESINSFVEERSRIFHEDIPIPGTDMTLHYGSNRVEGYKAFISVPSSGDTVPASLKRIIVKVEVAGRTLEQILDPLPNQRAEFIWDRLDHLGRQVSCATTAHVSVGFEYDLVYYSASSDFLQAFAQVGDNPTLINTRQGLIYWKHSVVHLEGRISAIAEGWTISSHHHLSPMDPSFLHKGDGTLNKNNAKIITNIAGNGTYGYSGDGGPATDAAIFNPHGVAVDAVGNIYIADQNNHRIRKVDTSGIIITVAGNGAEGYSGDGGPATAAALNRPACLDVDAAGNIYIADQNNHRIRKVDTSGIITTVAGNGVRGYSGDDGPAIEAEMNLPVGVAVDDSGNLYIVEHYGHRIRKVDTGNIITTVAGNGDWGYSGDGGPATEAELYFPVDVVLDAAGNLYIADYFNDCIRKVDTSGIITTVAGNGTGGYSGDGGPATDAMLYAPAGVELDSAGNLYIACFLGNRIRIVDTSGIITTVAGNGVQGYSGDDGPATEAEFNWPAETAMDAAGNLYIADHNNHRIRKVALPKAFAPFVAAGGFTFVEENGLGHILSSAGLHLRTIDLDTGIVLREFGYDQDNNLVSITDQFGNQITIQRSDSGVPTAIVSPDGITTGLTIDTNNNLTRITYPDGNFYDFEYTLDGLMTAEIEPEENRFEHVFDSIGRLTDATDQVGGHWHYSRYIYENGDILTEALTGEGNLTSYLDHTYTTGAFTSTITGPTGTETLFTQSSDGLTVNKSLPCGMELESKYGIDPEYKFKYAKETRESTPTGLEKVTLRNKICQDTNDDEVPDLITEAVTINGKGTTIVNNVLQSQKTITSPEGRTVNALYDPATLLTTNIAIPDLYDTAYGYTTKGRLTSIDTNTRRIDLTYNAQGFLETITDPEDHTTTYYYDPVGRVNGINRPDGSSVGFTYNANGNMTVLTNPSTINHVFGYNSVNLNSSYQTPLSGGYSYVYDNDRRLIQTNFPSGNQINNIYANGRLEQIQTPEGNIDFTYLCGNKVESIAKGGESTTYEYDGNLITSDTLAGTLNQTLGYSYNNDFNLTGLTYAGGTANYVYDNDGLLTGAGSFTVTRNAGNGLPESVSDGALSLSRAFNGYGEVSDEDYVVSGQGITSWNLIRNNAGRITTKTETVAGTTSNYVYTYDPMGRLRTVTKDSTLVEEYQYDPNGTRNYEMNALRGIAGRSFTYSDEDHLLTAGTDIYQYDLDGFLTSKTDGTDVTQYDYSSRGELLSVVLPNGTFIEYVHDPLGRRIAKKVDGTTVEKYLWQGLTRLLTVYDGSDNLLMRFVDADSRMPVAMTSGGSTYYLTYDQVGSLRLVADAAGNVVKKIDYDSFGNVIYDSDPTLEIPFGFAGGLHDRDTGLVRFGYRDYDPDVGRWTAKDPIFFAGGDKDLYGYCLNDPINLVDPFGLYLTVGQQITISFISGAGAAVGTFLGGGPLTSGLLAGTAGAITTALMEGSTWQDVLQSGASGLLAGITGSGIANLLEGTMLHSMRAATGTGVITGWINVFLMGANPIISQSETNQNPCK